MSYVYDITNFTATAYDGVVLLSWTAGKGADDSAATSKCKVTIQYSTEGYPSDLTNTPPYLIRDLEQLQNSNNMLYHPNLKNGTKVYYSLFIYYYDTGRWYGPYHPTPQPALPTTNVSGSFDSTKISFCKLNTNTRVSPRHEVVSDVIVWLPKAQEVREGDIETALNAIKPAHVKLNIKYERYFIARTTTTQLNAFTFNSNIYEVANGTLKNKVATIDSSHSGQTHILGGT